MKYSRWPLVLAAIALCLLVASPMNADAASQSAPSDQKHSNATPHAAKKSSGDTETRKSKREKSSDKSASSHSSRSKRDKAESRSKSKSKSSAKESASIESERRDSTDSRDIWMKRAQESEIMSGKASWYGRDFHGGSTASGLDYDMYTFTAAHRTLPMGTVVRVTDQQNGKSVMVCVTDRGPFVRGRIIDLSFAAAQQIDIDDRGISRVQLEVVSDESGTPLKPDEAFFVRYNAAQGDERIGPFRAFADAAAMHEALRQVHPEAEVVMDQSK
ncbi:septal ring lytic transglycosylase RlpA family protein [Desulfovibrio desulfuricans]|uniref:Probable endolytic peptidoglycan transglycosylase RlpA n=1 Tax=Desulfovibrio desulfuricans TaxID=876 RepID=A0A4P7UIP7_DESDE|nr:septal ring lytic transglycosylase RlpA family protein [Desulfovibrio desulfuricans]QCC84634.1 septal ring lytic transglycosylase RlpA family protein [Desulfovibrio desulfuricans]